MLWMLSLLVLSLRPASAGPTYWSVSLPRTRCPPTPRQPPPAGRPAPRPVNGQWPPT